MTKTLADPSNPPDPPEDPDGSDGDPTVLSVEDRLGMTKLERRIKILAALGPRIPPDDHDGDARDRANDRPGEGEDDHRMEVV